jgi:hypothetical protein
MNQNDNDSGSIRNTQQQYQQSHQELGFGISIPAAKRLRQVPQAAVFGLCHAIKNN